MDKLLHVIQVSEKLNCSKPTVYKLVEKGKLKAVQIGERGLRIKERSLRDFLKKSAVIPENIEVT
jgi:excisionase family DNA binding protein